MFTLRLRCRLTTEPQRQASSHLLDEIRLLVLNETRVENPNLYPMLRRMGFDDLPDQSTSASITFADCVVSHGPISHSTLFHELLHVEQYRQLGIRKFAESLSPWILERRRLLRDTAGICYQEFPVGFLRV